MIKAQQKAQQFVPLVTQIPCNSISKRQDEYLNVRVNYQWQGASTPISGYAVVTQETFWGEFDEIGSTKMNFSVTTPNSPGSPTTGYFVVSYLPLAGCAAKSGYGVKVKVSGFAEWGCKNVLTVTSGAGQQLGVTSLQIS